MCSYLRRNCTELHQSSSPAAGNFSHALTLQPLHAPPIRNCPNKLSSSTTFLTPQDTNPGHTAALGTANSHFGTALGRLKSSKTLAIIGLGRRDGWDGGW